MSDADITFDFQRADRVGFPEIVYGEHKSADQLLRIAAQCVERGHDILVSRCNPAKAEALCAAHEGTHDPVGNTWVLQKTPPPTMHGRVAVISGGTADAPVVQECCTSLGFMGIEHQSMQDIGVAGIHRFMNRLEELRRFQIVICAAGFEGALASVSAGQLACPVIGVPTSVGYGVADGGRAALHAMLASCANGLSVMNIDNGVGAALAARRILSLLQS